MFSEDLSFTVIFKNYCQDVLTLQAISSYLKFLNMKTRLEIQFVEWDRHPHKAELRPFMGIPILPSC